MNFRKLYTNHIIKRLCSSLQKNQVELLTKELDITEVLAIWYINKHDIIKNVEELKENLNFYRKIGYTTNDVLNYPKLLKRKCLLLDQHYLLAQECGFKTIPPSTLLNKIFHMPVEMLKLKDYIPSELDVVKSFVSHLSPPPSLLQVDDLNDECALSYVHLQVMKRYLMWRLETTMDDIERLFRIHKMIKNKSFRYLCKNIKIAEQLGFSKEKMLKFGYILHNYPHYTETVLKTMPQICGTNTAREMRTYPKLVMVSPQNYKLIYKYLKEANINDETVAKSMNIFHLSPKTVKRCLDEITSNPNLSVYLGDTTLLKIVIHNKRATSRLKLLQQSNLKCVSLHKLRTDKDVAFEAYIKEGKDTYLPRETITFVSNLLNSDKSEIERKLKIHPYYTRVPFTRIQETYNYLRKLNYTNEHIFKIAVILLYPVVKITEALEIVNSNHTGRISKIRKLNMILYHIEKVHHFNGNGIWLDDEDI